MTTIVSSSNFNSGIQYGVTAKTASTDIGDPFANLAGRQTDSEKSAGPEMLDDPGTRANSSASTVIVMIDGKAFTGRRLDIDVSSLQVDFAKLSENDYRTFVEGSRQSIEANRLYLESQYTTHSDPDLSRDPRLQPYATVSSGGKVIATIDNQGVVTTFGGISSRFLEQLPDSVNGTNGPDLAKARAEAFAGLVGDRVETSPSAITQRQFNALPEMETPVGRVDYDAMKRDPLYQMTENMQSLLEEAERKRAAPTA